MPSRTAMRIRGEPGELELPISMIDVVFLLLVFFICTLQFRSIERKLDADLPKDNGVQGRGDFTPPAEIRVKIYWANSRGQVIHSPTRAYPAVGVTTFLARPPLSIAGAHVEMKVNRMRMAGGAGPDLNELARTLDALVARCPRMPVVIDARRAVPFKWVVGALDACARARVKTVKFQAPPVEGGGGSDWWWM